MGTGQFETQVEPLAAVYLPGQFGVPGKPSVHEWSIDLDKLFDALESNGTGRLGNTLITLDVSVPGRALAGWLAAPVDGTDAVYCDMSRRIQGMLKQLVPFCYFREPARYKGGNPVAAAVLTYAAIPPSNGMRLEGGRAVAAPRPDPYWDVFDPGLLSGMTEGNPSTRLRLSVAMARVQRLLAASREESGDAGFYAPDQLGSLLQAALGTPGRQLLASLLFTEAEVVKAAVEGGQSMGRFRAIAETKPAQAIESLADFGHRITSAFNRKLTDLFDPKTEPDLLRNFGSMVFIEASRAFQQLGAVQPVAMLGVTILRKDAPFPPEGFPHHDPLPRGAVGVEQRVISAAAFGQDPRSELGATDAGTP
jgi:hypothetical protein